MNSATDIWPEGLGSSSGQLGHNVMDHHFRCGASGKMEGYEDKYYYGRRPNGIYIPRFRNIYEDKRDYVRGFGYQGSASRDGWNREIAETILPETKTPGAKDAAVGEFMKIMVNDCYTPKDQKVFHEGIKKLDEACKKMYNMGFMDITPGQRHDLFLTTNQVRDIDEGLSLEI